jgi:hypothetical protein
MKWNQLFFWMVKCSRRFFEKGAFLFWAIHMIQTIFRRRCHKVHWQWWKVPWFQTSVSNSVLNFQYRGRPGIIPVLAGIEVFSLNIPLPPQKSGKFVVKTAVKCIQYNLDLCTFIFNELLTQKCWSIHSFRFKPIWAFKKYGIYYQRTKSQYL